MRKNTMSKGQPAIRAPFFWLFGLSIIAYVLILAVVLALAVATAWLLRKLVPGLETGASLIISVVATAFSLFALFKVSGSVLTKMLLSSPVELLDEADDEEDESPVIYAVPPFPTRHRKLKRKPRR
jgi:hypothetical protein